MVNKDVMIVSGKDEFELCKNINSSKISFMATQPKQKIDGSWIAFCYYDSNQVSDEFATEKQKDFIYKNNISVNTENLTKKEAFKLIQEHINNNPKPKNPFKKGKEDDL